MSMLRQNITRGPGTIQIGSGPVFYDKDGIDANIEPTRFAIETSFSGEVDSRRDDVQGVIDWTPSGQLSANILTALYPYQDPDIGASIFGSTDTAAIIHSKAGKKVTLYNTAVTGMPDLMLSASKTLFGQAQLTALYKNNTDPTDAEALYKIESEAWSDTSFTTAAVKTVPYLANWGSLIASIITEEGWTISFDVGTTPRPIDDIGTIDMDLDSVGVLAKCKPVNGAEDILDDLRLQGASVARGMTERQSEDLTISAAGVLSVVINDATLTAGPLRWGKTDVRQGELAFIGHRKEDSGAFTDLFTLTAG